MIDSLKQKEKESISDLPNKELLFDLVHEIRRPITNIVTICEQLKLVKETSGTSSTLLEVLNKALRDFDKAISEYERKILD